MYIARHAVNGKPRYILRRSCRIDGRITHQDLVDLGGDPADHLVYPGGNAFYVSTDLEDLLADLGVQADSGHLEDLFWPFVRPEIRMAVDAFRHRSAGSTRRKLTETDKTIIRDKIPGFDKRRIHFLKFGSMDQGPVSAMPPVLFRRLIDKSRDEIEQFILDGERRLRARELKTYVYVAFNLQQFFQSFMATKMPHVLDQDKVDEHFISEICRTNTALFSGPRTGAPDRLHDYLVRYIFMFFDHEYDGTTLLDDFANAFMNRHRFYRPPGPPKHRVSMERSSRIFGIPEDELAAMSKRNLTRHYRRLARKLHPDTGGSDQAFIDLNEAFQSLLNRQR